MATRLPFVLLLAAIFLVAPHVLQASHDGKNHDKTVAATPPAGIGEIDGLRITAHLQREGKRVTVVLTSPEAERPLATRATVALLAMPPMARFSRVVMPPREIEREVVALRLQAGERLAQRVSFELGRAVKGRLLVSISQVKKTSPPPRARATQQRAAATQQPRWASAAALRALTR